MTTTISGTTGIDKVTPELDATIRRGRKNILINGAMTVAQRGTSFTGISTATYTLDRVQVAVSGTFGELSITAEKSSDAPDGFSNSLKLTTATAEASLAANERLFLGFYSEGQDVQNWATGTSNASAVTMSFWVKSSVVGTYALYAYGYTGNAIESHSITVDLANTWEKKAVTFSANTATALFANNATRQLEVGLVLSAGSDFKGASADTWSAYSTTNLANAQTTDIASTLNATFQLTGLQLELGSVATDFEHRSYAEELALCQRYYEKSYNQIDAPATSSAVGKGSASSYTGSSSNRFFVGTSLFCVAKRATPTVTIYSSLGTANRISAYDSSATELTVSSISEEGESSLGMYIQTSSGDNTRPYTFHFTAEAEL